MNAPVQGGLPKVTEVASQILKTAVSSDPRTIGENSSVWDCKQLARHLEQQGCEKVSRETIRRQLHHLNFRIVRPVLSVKSPDPQYQDKASKLLALQKQAQRGEIILLYEDEVDLKRLPGLLGCWTERGQQIKVTTPPDNQKRYGFGAVNYISGKTIYLTSERKNSLGFEALLEEIVKTYPHQEETDPKIVLVIDNFKIHYSKVALAALERHKEKLEIFRLPTYAPELNLIERVWKYMRRRVTHNHLFATIALLVQSVEAFFRNLDHKTVLSILGHSG
ncbi:MAG: IS630 family transposase [Chlorobiales bacterium]|nr:IS630 family transposase [Chlorobiales bacterium]